MGEPASDRLAAEIRRVIAATGLTLTALGSRLGCSKQALSAYQNGERPPARDTLLALLGEAGMPERAKDLTALLTEVDLERKRGRSTTGGGPDGQVRAGGRSVRRMIAVGLVGFGMVVGLLAGVLWPGTGPNADAPPNPPRCDRFVVIPKDLYLRDDNSGLVGHRFVHGQQVRLRQQHPDIARLVEVTADDGRTGWVDGAYLAPACA